jgi:hypothetical protein
MSALYPQGPEDNYHDTIEVRIKTLDDVGTPWEEIEPQVCYVGKVNLPEDVAKMMANIDSDTWEVRWNWGPGYYNNNMGAGHYIGGPARHKDPGPTTRIVEVK